MNHHPPVQAPLRDDAIKVLKVIGAIVAISLIYGLVLHVTGYHPPVDTPHSQCVKSIMTEAEHLARLTGQKVGSTSDAEASCTAQERQEAK